MNLQLREEIVKHVMANLGILESEFVSSSSKSLRSKIFLLHETLPFEDEAGETINNHIWGCQFSASDQEIKIILGDCSQYENVPEFALVVQLKNAPAYGLYLICSNEVESETLIACSLDKTKDWMECGTYLQAMFLAGMEQIKNIGLTPSKCTDYQIHLDLLKSFVQFHSNIWS